jgi:hypothetical protein
MLRGQIIGQASDAPSTRSFAPVFFDARASEEFAYYEDSALRLYSPLQPFFDRSWRVDEIEAVS